MLDAIGFEEVCRKIEHSKIIRDATIAFVRFIERRLGVSIVYDASRISFREPELADLFLLADGLRKNGVIYSYSRVQNPYDELPLFQWRAACQISAQAKEPMIAGGGSHESDRRALIATLAEAVERHVWAICTDHLKKQEKKSIETATRGGRSILPERFAGISPEHRKVAPHLRLLASQEFVWTEGYSWTQQQKVWLPLQTVSGVHIPNEPLIVERVTTGCAVHESKELALLSGALEVIERDAYMIMWLNQLTLPRLDLDDLSAHSPALTRLLQHCEQYRFKVHVVQLISDAPACVVCAVVEDESGLLPKRSYGLKAHTNAATAAEGALVEALRMRQVARSLSNNASFDETIPTSSVGHMDRLQYWMVGDRYKQLNFITTGPVRLFDGNWDNLSSQDSFDRIVTWCRNAGYECASISLTSSEGNPTSWHIEKIVIPELQPMHLSERHPHTYGTRLQEIPTRFGYQPLAKPHTQTPHPFA